jgi:hypothetical protein
LGRFLSNQAPAGLAFVPDQGEGGLAAGVAVAGAEAQDHGVGIAQLFGQVLACSTEMVLAVSARSP